MPDNNRLAEETSPYLRQHRDNPVHWQPWDDVALAEARRTNRPILLSVGYAACHWCHVMAHESFEDPDTAAAVNAHFVAIKVDREERPDIDAIYQAALALLGQQGGWPLTMFLTPRGEPFWGGTYFPPEARHGRPAFREVLRRVAGVWDGKGEDVSRNVAALAEALKRLAESPGGDGITPALIDQVTARLVREIDPFHGGFGGAPKFPQPSHLDLLWRAWCRSGREPYARGVTLTLDGLCEGGIYDHLGGGFARYAVDEVWLVPHFEKMLYDNAQLITLLTRVWTTARNPLYAARVAETVAWADRELTVAQGGFASALDADSEGEEGRFYVWSAAEIESVLGDAAAAFMEAYDVTPEGNWEGKVILNRSGNPGSHDAGREAALAASRQTLFAVRAGRIPPGRDDKVLADWNGLMVSALAEAGLVFDRPDWVVRARRAYTFVTSMMSQPGDRLHHSWCAGKARHPGVLDDYANMAQAALALYEAQADPALIEQAVAWVAVADRHFHDPEGGGYYFSADDTPDLIVRSKTALDNAVPAGNGTLVGVLARLYVLTGDTAFRDRAEATIASFSGMLARSAYGPASLLAGAGLLHQPVSVVLVGPRRDPALQALRLAAAAAPEPNRVLQTLAPEDRLPGGHPAVGKGMVDGRATAYVCRGATCQPPATDPHALRALLSGNPG